MDTQLKRKTLPVYIHILGWLCIFILPFLFGNQQINDYRLALKLFIDTLSLALFFYLNIYVLIPKLLGRKQILLYILALILCIVAVAIFQLSADYYFFPRMFLRHWFIHIRIGKAIFGCLLVIIVSGGLKITGEWFENERQRKEMENEKLASELAFLKSQVNPHFLFNTLNNVYSLAYKKSEETPEAILKLSELMRYMLYDSNVDRIGLDKEIKYIRNYIALQKMRISDAVQINFEIEGTTKGHTIEPMLLIPFVENAFKHGLSYSEQAEINMLLKVNDHELYFKVENTLTGASNENKDKSSGIGLQNIKRRLMLLYPDKHELLIEKKDGKYLVELKIILHK